MIRAKIAALYEKLHSDEEPVDEEEFIHEPTIDIRPDPTKPMSLAENEANFKETGTVSMNLDSNYTAD